jgi:ABC-type transporter Mla maintaining outer membrane lipid asymmetry permease subunit MlaE
MRIVAVLFMVLLITGCTMTKVTTDYWSVSRISFFQQVEIPTLKVSTNGVVQMTGYKSDGGEEGIKNVTEEAIRTAISAVKGALK